MPTPTDKGLPIKKQATPADLLMSAIIFAILFGFGMVVGCVLMMWFWQQ